MKAFSSLQFVTVVMLGIGCASVCVADETPPAIQVIGRSSITVTADTIRFEDLAEISSPAISDDESVIALKKIQCGTSPAPGKKLIVQAQGILERLKASRVDLNQIRYTFPQTIEVTRASRAVTSEEVQAAIEAAISTQNRDVTIKQVRFEEQQILPGVVSIRAQELSSQNPGQLPFAITIKVSDSTDTKFKAVATVEEWRDVPVAAKPLAKGSVVNPGDIAMARLSTASIPKGAADQSTAIVGLATNSNIALGEVFQRAKLAIPPVVSSGSRVTMIVRTSILEATASGVALESGIEGQEIKVRNESSKRVVSGKVTANGTVIINPGGGSL